MTFYRDQGTIAEAGPPPPIPEDERPPAGAASFGEVAGAAWRAETIRTDAWGYERRKRTDLALEMFGQLPDEARTRISERRFDHENNWITFEEMVTDEASQLVARDPGKWGQYPLDKEQFDAEITRRRKAELDEAQQILDLPGGAVAEFLGTAGRAVTDQTSLMLAPFGLSGSPGRFIAGEAVLGAAGEAAILPREFEVARELDQPTPSVAGRIALGAVFGGGLAAGLTGLGRAARYLQLRHELRGSGRPADADALEHQARVAAGEARLRDEIPPLREALAPEPAAPTGAPLRMRDFDFSASGNASPKSNRVGYVFGRLLALGYEPHVAAGLVGNLMQESGPTLMTRAVGDGGNSIGMGQWNGPRRRALIAFAARRGTDPADLDTQIAFLDWELKNTEAAAFARISQARTAAEAAEIASAEFWRPGIPHLARRAGYARQVFDQYGQGAVPRWAGRTPAAGDDVPVFAATSRGFTRDGQVRAGDVRLDVDYEVVDASILRQATGDLQPRDRTRIASDAWVAETAAGLDPALLRPSPTADRGAPLVGPDDIIESGNGRVRAIERVYERFPDRAAAYRADIEAMTGAPIPEGIERPVLIARRRTPLDDDQRRRLVAEAQDSGVARMTPTEISQVTGRAMTADTLALLQPGARLADADNAPFVNRVLSRLPAAERGAMFDAAGRLNAEGARRLRGALFARAWPDRDLIARYAELEDAGPLKSLLGALERAAPEWAALKSDIEAGLVRPEFDISPFVIDAMRLIAAAREASARGEGPMADLLEELLADVDLLDGALPDLTVALVRKFHPGGRAADADTIAGFLSDYAARARELGRPSMLEDGTGPSELLRAMDGKTFADVGEIAPRAIEAPREEMPDDLPGEAYAEGAASAEAELADEVAAEALTARTQAAEAAEDLGEIEITLADGTTWRASELVADAQEDLDLAEVLEACRIGGANA